MLWESRARSSHDDHSSSQASPASKAEESAPAAQVFPRSPPLSDVGSFRMTYERQHDVPIASFRDDTSISQVSEVSQDSWEVVAGDSQCSFATHLSLASAPVGLSVPRCFLPRTRFRQPEHLGGGHITAAELHSCGGDVVLGPLAREVRVEKSVRHERVERDLIKFHMAEAETAFTVTADHRLKLEGPVGVPVVEEARALVQHAGSHRVFDGHCFRTVVKAQLFPKQ